MKRSDASSQREFTGGVSTSGFSQVESDACATLQPGVNISINSGSDPITITRADGEMTLTAVGDDVTITGYVNVLDGSLQDAPPNSKVLTAGDTVVFTIPTDQADIELDFGGQVILHSADNALDLSGGNPLELQAPRPTHLRYAQRTLDKKDYELTDHLGNVLATISDRKTGITDSVESTVFSDNFTDGVDAWQFREAGSIQASEGYMYVYTEGEGHYAYRSVSINTGSGCNYSICLDLTETEIEEGLSLVVHDGESALYTLSLTPNAQNCFENLTLPENFQLQLHASVAGSYYVDNISITKKCVEFKYYVAHVTSAKDYYPFGMVMPGRKYTSSEKYRYGFNGYENDDEIKGESNSIDYIARMYDPRLGRFLSIDPLTGEFPYYSPYQFAGNKPIIAIDLLGLQPEYMITKTGKLTQPVISVLNAAFSYDKEALGASTWSYFKDTKSGKVWFFITGHPTASVSGQSVYHDAKGHSEAEWLGLIAHEESHRQDIHRMGNFDFYARYLVEGSHKDYRDISTEQKAYNYGSDRYSTDQTDKLLSFKGGAVLDILGNEELGDSEKAGQLRTIGLEFRLQEIINPALAQIKSDISSLEAQMESFSGHPDDYKAMETQLANLKTGQSLLEGQKKEIEQEIN